MMSVVSCELSRSSVRRQPPAKFSHRHFNHCRASWQELAGVLVFSAIPFTAVKAIANSPLGETLQTRMQQTKKLALNNAKAYQSRAQNAKKDSFWYGEERPRWLGPIPFEYPTYLDGDLPGDYGFDIAGLSQDPIAFKRYYNFEILHARWAMLAALGALIPELLDRVGAFHFVEAVWWRVGYSKLQGEKEKIIRELTSELDNTNQRCEGYRANLLAVLRDMEEQKLKLSVKVQNARLSLKE